jgi:hypothetical protein
MIVEVMSAYELLKQEKKDKPEALTFPSGHFGPAPHKALRRARHGSACRRYPSQVIVRLAKENAS